MAQDVRSYAAGKFSLLIGGKSAGYVKKFDGLTQKSEVAVHNLGPQLFQKKQPTIPTIEDMKWESGIGMSKELLAWIQGTLDLAHTYKDGEVIVADSDYNAKYSRQFYQALITKFTIPTLDASSKEGGYFSLEAAVENMTQGPASGKLQGEVAKQQKSWTLANFEFKIGDLPCQYVSKVEGLGVTQKVTKDDVGMHKLPQKIPTAVEFTNFKVTCSAKDIDPWAKFFDSFIIQGNSGDDAELTASVNFLAHDMKTVLGTYELYNCGILSLTRDALEANKDGVGKFVAEFYCEHAKLTLNVAM